MSATMSMLTRRWNVVAITASATALLLSTASAITPLSPWQNGIATNYGGAADGMSAGSPSFGTQDGSCGYGELNQNAYPYWSVGALATSNAFYSAGPLNGCGQCFQIECLSTVDESKGTCNPDPTLRSVTVMISDECPQCASDQIDLQALTFNKMAPMSVGRINTRYRSAAMSYYQALWRVECTPPADMKLSILDNEGVGGWIRLSVQETGGRGAVQTVQMKGGGSSDTFQTLDNKWGAEWESGSQPDYPLTFRMIPDQGSMATAFNILSTSDMGMVPTRVQFTMHDQPSTGPQQEAANQGQVQAYEGPPDFSSTNTSSNSSNSGSSSGNSGSTTSYGSTSGDGSGNSTGDASWSPGSSASSGGTASSSSGTSWSSGEGSGPATSDSSASNTATGGRRLLRHI